MLQALDSRAVRLRVLSARLYRLSELASLPPKSHAWADRLIDEGEDIAMSVRAEFR